jgi:4'-phosphopantetheinyl transferase
VADVYWLEQAEADVPADDDWLSPPEILQLGTLRVPKRRTDWRLGRWTAKCAVAACLKTRHPLNTIEIHAAPDGAPEVRFTGKPPAVSISLSHRGGLAICAVCLSAASVGCDLELIEPRSDAFLADYFNSEEQAVVARASAENRSWLLTLIWSGKESALKALRAGLRLDTRSVTVGFQEPEPLDSAAWHPFHVHCSDGQIFRGWWQSASNLIRTVVADPPPAPPIRLYRGTGGYHGRH